MDAGPAARGWRARLLPTLRVVLYLVLLLLAYAFTGALLSGLELLSGLGPAPSPLARQLAGYLVGILPATVLITLALRRWFDRRDLVSLGLGFRQNWLAHLALGAGTGGGLMGVVLLGFWLGDWVQVQGVARPVGGSLQVLLAESVLFGAVALAEELAFRGYVLQNLSQGWGRTAAVLGSAAIFASLHLLNPHVTVLGALNVALAGILFAYAYLVSRGLWLPLGLHFGWNLVQGTVLAFPVSGTYQLGLLRTSVQGPDALTGGAFGPEAGLVASGALLLGVGLVLGWGRLREGARSGGVGLSPGRTLDPSPRVGREAP